MTWLLSPEVKVMKESEDDFPSASDYFTTTIFSLFCFRAWNKEFKCFSIVWYIRHYFWKESRFGTCYICCLYRTLCFRKAQNNLFVRYSFKQVRTAHTMLLTTKLNKIHMRLSYADKYIKQGFMPFKWMLWRLVYSEKWQVWTLKSIHMLYLGAYKLFQISAGDAISGVGLSVCHVFSVAKNGYHWWQLNSPMATSLSGN